MMESTLAEESPTSKSRPMETTPRILIVDDDEGILQSLSQLLRLTYPSYRVGTATSSEEALAILQRTSVNLVITDLKLPSLSGLELLKRVRKSQSKARFILMTAYGNEDVMEEAHDNGCVAYLQKPFDLDLLLRYIDAAVKPEQNLQAELTGLHIVDILELYAKTSRNALLSITCEGASGMVVVQNGILTHAQFEHAEGEEALLKILSLRNGLITSLDYQPPKKNSLRVYWQDLRMLATEAEDGVEPVEPRNPEIPLSFRPDVQEVLGNETRESPFTNDDFKLHAAPDQVVLIKEAKVKKLVLDGIEHFRAHHFEAAGDCWMKALRLDPDCVPAKKNLQHLEKMVNDKQPVH